MKLRSRGTSKFESDCYSYTMSKEELAEIHKKYGRPGALKEHVSKGHLLAVRDEMRSNQKIAEQVRKHHLEAMQKEREEQEKIEKCREKMRKDILKFADEIEKRPEVRKRTTTAILDEYGIAIRSV